MFVCTGKFTRLGDSEILWVAEKMTFHGAESHCRERDSGLIEFWNEAEWEEVSNAFKFEG